MSYITQTSDQSYWLAYVRGIDNTALQALFDFSVHSNIITNINAPGSSPSQTYGIDDESVADYNDLWHVLQGGTEHPWNNISSQGVGNLFQDPMFVNNSTAPYDYHLKTESPCMGTGKDGADMGALKP